MSSFAWISSCCQTGWEKSMGFFCVGLELPRVVFFQITSLPGLRHYQDYVIIRLGLPRVIHAPKNECGARVSVSPPFLLRGPHATSTRQGTPAWIFLYSNCLILLKMFCI